MNMMDALDIAGPLLIALGTLPIAAGLARLALKAVMAALPPDHERLPS